MAEQSWRAKAAEALRATRGDAQGEVSSAAGSVRTSNLSFKLDPEAKREVEEKRKRIRQELGLDR